MCVYPSAEMPTLANYLQEMYNDPERGDTVPTVSAVMMRVYGLSLVATHSLLQGNEQNLEDFLASGGEADRERVLSAFNLVSPPVALQEVDHNDTDELAEDVASALVSMNPDVEAARRVAYHFGLTLDQALGHIRLGEEHLREFLSHYPLDLGLLARELERAPREVPSEPHEVILPIPPIPASTSSMTT